MHGATIRLMNISTLPGKGAVIAVPFRHMKLLERCERSTTRLIQITFEKIPTWYPSLSRARVTHKPIVPAGILASHLPAPSLFNVSAKLTQPNRVPCYSNPVFNHVSSYTLYTCNAFEYRMSELVLPCKYLLLY